MGDLFSIDSFRNTNSSGPPVAGLLWGSCLHPIPMRVWCFWPTSWEIYFSRVELDPDKFVEA